MKQALLQYPSRKRYRHRAQTGGFPHQGDWVFIPSPGFTPHDEDQVLYQEPIQRQDKGSHIADRLYRLGGETVYVCREYPAGLPQSTYAELVRQHPGTQRRDWRVMRRNLAVYVSGQVQHPDHETIVLPTWHRALLCRPDGSLHMVFLD